MTEPLWQRQHAALRQEQAAEVDCEPIVVTAKPAAYATKPPFVQEWGPADPAGSLADPGGVSPPCPTCGAWPCARGHVCWLADPPDPTVAAFTPQERAALRWLLRREGLL